MGEGSRAQKHALRSAASAGRTGGGDVTAAGNCCSIPPGFIQKSLSRLLGVVGGMGDRSHVCDTCSRLMTLSARPLGAAPFITKEKLPRCPMRAAAGPGSAGTTWPQHLPCCPVHESLHFSLKDSLLQNESTLKKKSFKKQGKWHKPQTHGKVQWLPVTQYFGLRFTLASFKWKTQGT